MTVSPDPCSGDEEDGEQTRSASVVAGRVTTEFGVVRGGSVRVRESRGTVVRWVSEGGVCGVGGGGGCSGSGEAETARIIC